MKQKRDNLDLRARIAQSFMGKSKTFFPPLSLRNRKSFATLIDSRNKHPALINKQPLKGTDCDVSIICGIIFW